MKIYPYKEDFFEVIDSEVKAYILGFFVADGSLAVRTRILKGRTVPIVQYSFEINVHEQEISALETVVKYVAPNTPIKTTNKGYRYIRIYNRKIIEDIMKFGILPRKTYHEMSIPPMSKELVRHFVRGYFDGDGNANAHISRCKRKTKTKGTRVYFQVTPIFQIGSKMRGILECVKSFLEEQGIKSSICPTSEQLFKISFAGKEQMRKVFRLFYNDANFFIPRKKENFRMGTLSTKEYLEFTGKESFKPYDFVEKLKQ